MKDAMLKQGANETIGQAEEVAEVAAFLAGQEYLTGQEQLPWWRNDYATNRCSLIENHLLKYPSDKGEYICLQIVFILRLQCNLAIGNTAEEFWNSLHEGKLESSPLRIWCFRIQSLMLVKFDFPHSIIFCGKRSKSYGYTYSLYAIYAAMEAWKFGGLNMERRRPRSCRCDCIIWYRVVCKNWRRPSIGCMSDGIEESAHVYHSKAL